MMEIKAKVTKNRLPQVQAAIRRKLVRLVNQTAAEVLAEAQQLAPSKTGALRNSGHLENDGGDERQKVVFDAPYARFVEFGTSKMAAQPFLRPAATAVRGRLRQKSGSLKNEIG